MKKLMAIILCLFLTSCVTKIKTEYEPLESLPENYTLEDAKNDGCVVFENGTITHGQDRWEAFASVVPEQKASVRLAFYYTLRDQSHYSPEHYEEIKDDYPKLFLHDLSYDGEVYTIRWFEDEEIVRTYRYMMRFEGEPSSQYALYDRYVRYVLVNDADVTWEQIERGLVSSQLGEGVDHYTVYTDLQ